MFQAFKFLHLSAVLVQIPLTSSCVNFVFCIQLRLIHLYLDFILSYLSIYLFSCFVYDCRRRFAFVIVYNIKDKIKLIEVVYIYIPQHTEFPSFYIETYIHEYFPSLYNIDYVLHAHIMN